MPNKRIFRTSEFPYHLTARANNREKFPGEQRFIWKTISSELYLQAILHGIRVHAFVLMPNHFHILLTCPGREVDQVMRDVMSSTTRIINSKHQRSGHIYGGRYSWSLVGSADYYLHVYKYVLRNPVKSRLCSMVGEYPYSSYSGLVGQVPLLIPIHDPGLKLDRLIYRDASQRDAWLNQPHQKEENEAIKRGLRRKEFDPGLDRNKRKVFALEC